MADEEEDGGKEREKDVDVEMEGILSMVILTLTGDVRDNGV